MGVSGENFYADGATIWGGNESDDYLFVAMFLVAIVTKFDEFAGGVLPFKIAAGDVVED